MSGSNEIYAEAQSMVDDLIENALKRLATDLSESALIHESENSDLPLSRERTFVKDENFEVPNIKWLTIDGFSIDDAKAKIDEFIQTWEFQNSWLYCIDFLTEESQEFDTHYKFRVRWSIPTRRKPIPRATASVYFTFVVSKIKPKNYPVDVFYVFETNRLVHRPGMSRFREKFLKDTIERKVILMSTATF